LVRLCHVIQTLQERFNLVIIDVRTLRLIPAAAHFHGDSILFSTRGSLSQFSAFDIHLTSVHALNLPRRLESHDDDRTRSGLKGFELRLGIRGLARIALGSGL